MKTARNFERMIADQMQSMQHMTMRFATNKDDAEDLYQETIYKALKNKDKFKPDTNVKAWLYTIMRNTYINSYNRAVKSKIGNDDTEGQYFLNNANRKDMSPVESATNYKELLEVVNKLEDVFRVPFKMMYEGYKYKEIADELDLPIGTVKSRIFFARQKLEQMIQK